MVYTAPPGDASGRDSLGRPKRKPAGAKAGGLLYPLG